MWVMGETWPRPNMNMRGLFERPDKTSVLSSALNTTARHLPLEPGESSIIV